MGELPGDGLWAGVGDGACAWTVGPSDRRLLRRRCWSAREKARVGKAYDTDDQHVLVRGNAGAGWIRAGWRMRRATQLPVWRDTAMRCLRSRVSRRGADGCGRAWERRQACRHIHGAGSARALLTRAHPSRRSEQAVVWVGAYGAQEPQAGACRGTEGGRTTPWDGHVAAQHPVQLEACAPCACVVVNPSAKSTLRVVGRLCAAALPVQGKALNVYT